MDSTKQNSPDSNGMGNDRNGDIARQNSAQSAASKQSRMTFCKRINSWRVRMAIVMQLVMVLFVLLRLNMPIALVCMIDTSSQNASLSQQDMTSPANSSSLSGERNSSAGTNSATKRGEFQWESSIQGLILSSANMLGFVTPLMTDFFSRLLGGKRLMLIGMALSAILTILQPIGARMSPYILIALRMGIGLVGGMAMPLVTEVFSWWAPENEKVSLVSFAFAGVNIGNVLVGVTSGYLCAVPIDNGWPFIFYVHGAMCLAWCLLWQICATIRPEDHPFISEEEKSYIIKTRLGMDMSQIRTSPPYKSILTSVPVWGCMGLLLAHFFSITIVFTFLPLYLSTLFGLNVEEVGLFSSVGYVARFLGTMMWGQLSNLILHRTHHGTTFCRKLIQCTGFYVSGASLIALGFISTQGAALGMLVIVLFSQSATNASGIIVPLDMAPRYSGFISGLFLTIGTLISLPGPIIASMMTEQGTLEEWRNVFIMAAVVFFVGATCFLILGSSKLQSWAVPADSNMALEKQNPLASDLMNRRMTVMSLGPPLSPGDEQRRFQFTITVSEPNIEEATVNEVGTTQPSAIANGIHDSPSTATNTQASTLDKSISDTKLKRKVAAAKPKHAAPNLPRSQSENITGPAFSNSGFEPDVQKAVELSRFDNMSDGQLSLKENATQTIATKKRFAKNARRMSGLKLDVRRSEEVVFEVGGRVVQGIRNEDDAKTEERLKLKNDVTKENGVTNKTRATDSGISRNANLKIENDEKFEEVDLGDPNESHILKQTRL